MYTYILVIPYLIWSVCLHIFFDTISKISLLHISAWQICPCRVHIYTLCYYFLHHFSVYWQFHFSDILEAAFVYIFFRYTCNYLLCSKLIHILFQIVVIICSSCAECMFWFNHVLLGCYINCVLIFQIEWPSLFTFIHQLFILHWYFIDQCILIFNTTVFILQIIWPSHLSCCIHSLFCVFMVFDRWIYLGVINSRWLICVLLFTSAFILSYLIVTWLIPLRHLLREFI